jgi:GMP synthase (glutamine-hydrolysing)
MTEPLSKVIVLQHHPAESPGLIADAVHVQIIRPFEDQPVPRTLDAAGLIIMGGPQSVYEQDQFPFLRAELRLIEDALARQKPILGVCLGSQLLAAALGAKVYPGQRKEIGWFDVTARVDPLWANAPRQFTAFHWHGDVFDLPAGATSLASSALTPIQAFRHGFNAYGLLFHLEVTGPQIAEMVTLFADEIHTAGVDARTILTGVKNHLPALQKIGRQVFGRWASLL